MDTGMQIPHDWVNSFRGRIDSLRRITDSVKQVATDSVATSSRPQLLAGYGEAFSQALRAKLAANRLAVRTAPRLRHAQPSLERDLVLLLAGTKRLTQPDYQQALARLRRLGR